MSLTIGSFTIANIPAPVADEKYKPDFHEFGVWLGKKFIGFASSYAEAEILAKNYIAKMNARAAPAPEESCSPSP